MANKKEMAAKIESQKVRIQEMEDKLSTLSNRATILERALKRRNEEGDIVPHPSVESLEAKIVELEEELSNFRGSGAEGMEALEAKVLSFAAVIRILAENI